MPEHEDTSDATRLHAFVTGHVQGVGFRWWVSDRADELGLDGYAKNLPDGRVEVLAQGPRQACEALLRLLAEQPSSRRRPGRVDGVAHGWLPTVALPTGFRQQ
ncbi:MAG: acylphosphatase [Actinomycetes bacterium]